MQRIGDAPTEPLRQERLSSGPMKYATQEESAGLGIGAEPLGQRQAFGFSEVVDFDAAADIEGSQARIPDEIGGCGNAEQAEGEPVEAGILRAAVVTFADGGEELVGGKGEAADGIDFIDENDHRLGELGEEDMVDGGNPALERSPARVGAPVIEELVFEVQLLAQAPDQSVVPLFGCEVLADRREVEDRDLKALVSQANDGPDHERGFAHLPGREDIAELALEDGLMEVAVGLTFDITEGVRAQGAAGNEESRVWFHQFEPMARSHYGRLDRSFPSSNAASDLLPLALCGGGRSSR